ncbi:MAG TPA: SGNH/GDSL hydrolase family protein [Candidatus Brocadiia bacterium]|nr:SGNH/GDSL hydrolase family protein [Candidatus Brocadiia bacterium]
MTRISGFLAVLILCLTPRGSAQEWQAWWDAKWPMRLAVDVVPAEARAGINTALVNPAEECGKCKEGGTDVRVVSQAGVVVPHALIAKENGRFDIEFLLANPAETRYYVYYGNPQAEAVRHDWDRALGGLRLATYSSINNYRVWEWQSFCEAFAKKGNPFGSEEWGYIDDVSNPFGQDEFYLSVYVGKFFCPVSGKYQIATNSDDSSFVFLDYQPTFTPADAGKIVVWRHDGVPSDDWIDPEYRQAIRTVEMARGVHSVVYLQAENGGKQLARFGWKTPQDDEIHTVPPEAFVKRIPAEIIARQEAGRVVNPYFTYNHRYNLTVNNNPASIIPTVFFQDRTSVVPVEGKTAPDLQKLTRKWKFSDGMESEEPGILREFAGAGDYEVKLDVVEAEGEQAFLRKLELGTAVSRPLSVFFQLEIGSNLIPSGIGAPVNLQFKSMAQRPRTFLLETIVSSPADGKEIKREKQDVVLTPGGSGKAAWTTVEKSVEQSVQSMLVSFDLSYAGVSAGRREFVIQSSQAPIKGLAVEGFQLVDACGRSVVLSVADLRPGQPRRIRKINGRPVRIAILDDSLAPPADSNPKSPRSEESGYLPELEALLSAEIGGRPVEATRISPSRADHELRPPVRFCSLTDVILPMDPDVVILCTSSIDVMDCVPPVIFESYLTAMTDQVLARSEAVPVMVTPLPIVGNPHQSRPYAVLVKRAGLRKSVAVADLYSRYLLAGREWPDFFRISGSENGYWMWPGRQGQSLLAQELAAVIGPILKGR